MRIATTGTADGKGTFLGRTGKSFPGWRHAVTMGWKCILRILHVY